MELKRSSGILLHPTSLPGPFGIGALGAEAYQFIDFLHETKQSVWQILPLGPTGYGNSPYSAFSAFAGNPLLICLERLVEAGDLDAEDLEEVRMPEGTVNYGFAYGFKERLIHKAAEHFRQSGNGERQAEFERFCAEQAYWLDDYAIFRALRNHFEGQPWNLWPEDIRRREKHAMRFWGEELSDQVYYRKYAQFVFFEQWFALKAYANHRSINILGDIPIFVAFDSADVWANTHLFHLDDNQNPTVVAGVPPDYFSVTGQRWGNPLYNWTRMKEEGYSWWLDRFRWNLAQTDMVRIDHFRGFEACWAIPASEKTAINGQWEPTPGSELFQTLMGSLGAPSIIAEDLGVITPEVEALRDEFGFPGMKILHFAFDSGPGNPYLPHNLKRNCVVYTGTHDNNTTMGWWKSLTKTDKDAVRNYLGIQGRNMPWDMTRLAMASVANLCIFPLQDILSLDGKSRMNTPGTSQGNWEWRFAPGALSEDAKQTLAKMTATYGRTP